MRQIERLRLDLLERSQTESSGSFGQSVSGGGARTDEPFIHEAQTSFGRRGPSPNARGNGGNSMAIAFASLARPPLRALFGD